MWEYFSPSMTRVTFMIYFIGLQLQSTSALRCDDGLKWKLKENEKSRRITVYHPSGKLLFQAQECKANVSSQFSDRISFSGNTSAGYIDFKMTHPKREDEGEFTYSIGSDVTLVHGVCCNFTTETDLALIMAVIFLSIVLGLLIIGITVYCCKFQNRYENLEERVPILPPSNNTLLQYDSCRGTERPILKDNQGNTQISAVYQRVHAIHLKECDDKEATGESCRFSQTNDNPVFQDPCTGTNTFKREIPGMIRFDLQLLLDSGESVALIMTDNGRTGTAFHAGTKYVMTALHVVKGFIEDMTPNGWRHDLKSLSNIAISFPTGAMFKVKRQIVAFNEELDYAILELKTDGPNKTYPEPFQFPVEAFLGEASSVHVIGCSNTCSALQTFEFNIDIIPRGSERVKNAKSHASKNAKRLKEDLKKTGNQMKMGSAYLKLDDIRFVPLSFHQEKGASGGPCVIIANRRPVVGCMILGEEPNFYFDLKNRDLIPTQHRIEYAVTMSAIRKHLEETNSDLSEDIFGSRVDPQMDMD